MRDTCHADLMSASRLGSLIQAIVCSTGVRAGVRSVVLNVGGQVNLPTGGNLDLPADGH